MYAIWSDAANVKKQMSFICFGTLGRSWRLLGGILERLGGVLERLGAVLGPSWSVLERLGGVLKRLGALLQAIWPDAENVENHWFSSVFRHLAALGGVLERLEAS